MPIAKVVRLRASPTEAHALDHVLARARQAFRAEAGTMHWDVYESGDAAERVLVEIFSDGDAVRRHDDSPAVAVLLGDLERLGVDILSADQFSQSSPIDKEK